MYTKEYDVKIFNSIAANMKSVTPFNGYGKEMAFLIMMLDEGIKLTRDYLDNISIDEIDDLINMVDDLIDEQDGGLLSELGNVSRAKLILAALETNKNAVLKDEDFF